MLHVADQLNRSAGAKIPVPQASVGGRIHRFLGLKSKILEIFDGTGRLLSEPIRYSELSVVVA
jgi:hypothetical protein